MRQRFLLGPAGTGKTFLCLAEIRQALRDDPAGPPLILLAPKQATFQLERQILYEAPGYTRLQILSFQRLAQFVLEESGASPPQLLSEDGRAMVLHALLTRRRKDLKIFHASAGLGGFARQLSAELRELQRRQLSPENLLAMAAGPDLGDSLRRKLQDLSLLLVDYLAWLRQHDLQDADSLLDLATEALKQPGNPLSIGGLWLDGFAEMTPQELDLLAAVAGRSAQLTLAFCLEDIPAKAESSWLSIWTGIARTFVQCRDRLSAVPGAQLTTQVLRRDSGVGRFKDSPALRHLESKWTQSVDFGAPPPPDSLRAVICTTPQSEAVLAAQEILRFARSGGRFREVAVLLRAMEGYHETLRRVFSRYEIPFFLDRREKVAQHPLAELTRSVLRGAAYGWGLDDWFGALKTGLVSPLEEQIDRLENEAIFMGWSGDTWFSPLPPDKSQSDWAERFREKWIGPFAKFRRLSRPTGPQLAATIRQLWTDLDVETKLEDWSHAEGKEGIVHATIWRQLNAWLDDLALAFAEEPMALTDWMPILEAGLAELSVGVIPPALDQVLIGTIDRSRNPDLKLVILLGINETVFPAAPPEGNLLNEADREELARHEVRLGPSRREFLSRERFFGYIACTRSRRRLVVACSERDAGGKPLNPSPFFSHLKSLFAALEIEKFTGADWKQAEHLSELSGQMARAARPGPILAELLDRPAFTALREQIAATSADPGLLPPEIAAQLYGPALRTSVSRLEDFAACSFKFFIHSGLRAEERQRFELDVRQRGSFQHEVLALFHNQLRKENKNWRDISPSEARSRVRDSVEKSLPTFRDGLMAATPQSRFAARAVSESLQDFVAATVEWMNQYCFDPHESELGFGVKDAKLPAWELDLDGGHRLIFNGKIDRVDLCRDPAAGDEAMAVVIDYKSGALKLDDILMANGLQLQLAAYLSVLRRVPNPRQHFGAERLEPVGVFYVNLRGQSEGGKTRSEVLQSRENFRRSRYQHTGRFDHRAILSLDRSGAAEGSQFKFRLNKDGKPHAANKDLLGSAEFRQLLDHVESELVRMGREIYAGAIAPNPYQKGNDRACDKCDYQAICRFDPWVQPYRSLKALSQ